jgi:hypothetical protein
MKHLRFAVLLALFFIPWAAFIAADSSVEIRAWEAILNPPVHRFDDWCGLPPDPVGHWENQRKLIGLESRKE